MAPRLRPRFLVPHFMLFASRCLCEHTSCGVCRHEHAADLDLLTLQSWAATAPDPDRCSAHFWGIRPLPSAHPPCHALRDPLQHACHSMQSVHSALASSAAATNFSRNNTLYLPCALSPHRVIGTVLGAFGGEPVCRAVEACRAPGASLAPALEEVVVGLAEEDGRQLLCLTDGLRLLVRIQWSRVLQLAAARQRVHKTAGRGAAATDAWWALWRLLLRAAFCCAPVLPRPNQLGALPPSLPAWPCLPQHLTTPRPPARLPAAAR